MKAAVLGDPGQARAVLAERLSRHGYDVAWIDDPAHLGPHAGEFDLVVIAAGQALDAIDSVLFDIGGLTTGHRPLTLALIEVEKTERVGDLLALPFDAYLPLPLAAQRLDSVLTRTLHHGEAVDRWRHSEYFFDRVAASSPNIIWLFDLRRKIPLYVNGSIESTLGWTLPEVMAMGGSMIEQLVHPDDRGDLRTRIPWARLADAEIVDSELRVRHRAGHYLWMRSRTSVFRRDDMGVPIELVGTVEDITRSKEADAAVRRAQRDFREVVENIPDFVVLYREGKIVYINASGIAFFGSGGARDVIGREVLSFIHPDDREVARARVDALEARQRPMGPREMRVVRADNEIGWVEVVGGRTIDFEGQPAGLVVIRDITQRKRIQSRLMLADRMVSVGTLAAGVAHEINNPLSYVIGNLAYLSEQLDRLAATLPDDRRADLLEAVHEARDGAERVRIIVGDLRTFSREDDSRPQAMDVHAVLDSTLNIAGNELRRRAKLVKEYGDLPPVRANPSRLGQVFLNLLVNAAQALPESNPNAHRITLRTRAEGDRIIVEVSDTGPGIPPDIIDRIFDPFFTTKPVGVGTGLGLSICHNIVQSMDGEISVESAVGVGTTFRVSLLVARPREMLDAPTVRQDEEHQVRGRVLVVDDDPIVGRAVVRALPEIHDVTCVNDGERALALCRQDEWDVVLCDVLMPEMSGMDLYDAVCRERPGFEKRFVFMTGGTSDESVRRFFERVPNERVAKPFDVDQLRAIVRARCG